MANGAATMTVYERVFGTVELMDEILANLSPKNIFGIQRVSKQFYYHVNGDTVAARRAYLIPQASNTQFTTLLRDTKLRSRMLHNLPCSYKIVLDEINRIIDIEIAGQVDKLNVPCSWSKMLLTQPPVKQLWVKGRGGVTHMPLIPRYKRQDGPSRMLLTRSQGIRLSDVLQTVRVMRRSYKVRSPLLSFHASFDENGYIWNSDDANELRAYEGLTTVSVVSDGFDVRKVMHEDWE